MSRIAPKSWFRVDIFPGPILQISLDPMPTFFDDIYVLLLGRQNHPMDVVFVFISLYDTGSMHRGFGMCRNCQGNDEQLRATIGISLLLKCNYIAVYITLSSKSILGNTPSDHVWNIRLAFCKHILRSIGFMSRSPHLDPVILTK